MSMLTFCFGTRPRSLSTPKPYNRVCVCANRTIHTALTACAPCRCAALLFSSSEPYQEAQAVALDQDCRQKGQKHDLGEDEVSSLDP
jgi:hypothetical protein